MSKTFFDENGNLFTQTINKGTIQLQPTCGLRWMSDAYGDLRLYQHFTDGDKIHKWAQVPTDPWNNQETFPNDKKEHEQVIEQPTQRRKLTNEMIEESFNNWKQAAQESGRPVVLTPHMEKICKDAFHHGIRLCNLIH